MFIVVMVSVLVLALLVPIVLAHVGEDVDESLPENMQKMIEYKHEQADYYLRNLSFIVAFLAGILGILTPCSLAIFPAFFAYSFEGKRQITKMTSIFFLGFAPVFVIFGLAATFLGKTVAMFQQGNRFFVIIAGVVLIIFGLMVLFGKGFSGFHFNQKTKKTPWGIFLFGVLFAIGFTVCMGPILVGILLIAGLLQNYVYAAFLMLVYSLGLFVPLFLISMFFDKFNFSGFVDRINKRVGFSITNLIAGLLLLIMGFVFVFYGGTFITNNLGFGGVTVFIYSLQKGIFNLRFVNVIGVILLAGFLFLLLRVLRKKKDE